MVFANAVYYPSYRIYQNLTPATLRAECISHVFYAFAHVRSNGQVYLSDPNADEAREVDGVQGALKACVALKRRNARLQVLLSIGGGAFCAQNSHVFPDIAGLSKTRLEFGRTVRNLVDRFGLNGVDVDWEGISSDQDGENLLKLLFCVRSYLPEPQYLVTTALPASEGVLQHLDLHDLAKFARINLMAYDFFGPWSNVSGYHSQLRTTRGGICGHSSVQYLLGRGVPPDHILLGVPLYGRAFKGTFLVGQKCDDKQDRTFTCSELPRPESVELVDHAAVAACCICGSDGMVSYDNSVTVEIKAEYVREQKLGGLFFWEATQDRSGEADSLVLAGYRRLRSQ